jgi:hypothetical protein
VKYTVVLKAIMPTADPFLGYTVYHFQIMLCNILQLKFDVKIADDVLKTDILHKNVVLLN